MGVNADELFENIGQPVLHSENEVNDENDLSPFHSETDEEMPMVCTVTSTRDLTSGKKRSIFTRHTSIDGLYDTMLDEQTLINEYVHIDHNFLHILHLKQHPPM